MDRKLIFNFDILNNITINFNTLSSQIDNISFEIWDEIPEGLKTSYYNNENIINPVNDTFENWQTKLANRPNPIYSVALINNQVISSVYGAGLANERTMNLWATNPEYRQQGIGKVVVLNFIKHCFENNPSLTIRAWDVTSHEVDRVLTGVGFE